MIDRSNVVATSPTMTRVDFHFGGIIVPRSPSEYGITARIVNAEVSAAANAFQLMRDKFMACA